MEIKNRTCYLCNRRREIHFFHKRKTDKPCPQWRLYNYICVDCTQTDYGKVKSNAKKRGYEFSLTKTEYNLVIKNPCHYCGQGVSSGIDRKNNAVGYVFTNCLPCCRTCNKMKGTYDYDDFIKHCNLIVKKYIHNQ